MHTTVYDKSTNFHACWPAWRLANVIAWCHFFNAAYATTRT